MNTKQYSGFAGDTAQNLAIDSCAIFVDFDIETDTYDTAVAAGKLLGSSQGAIQFSAIPTMRQPEINGLKVAGKGLQFIEGWEVKLTGNVITITKEAIQKALAGSDIDISGDFYDKITARFYLQDTDYYDNITIVGKITGTENPIIIQLFNALNIAGVVASFEDSSEMVIPVEFMGHVDLTSAATRDTVPFEIYRPKAEGSVSGVISDVGGVVSGATVKVTIDTTDFEDTTAADGTYLIENVPYGIYTVTATKDALTGNETLVTVVGGVETENVDITIA